MEDSRNLTTNAQDFSWAAVRPGDLVWLVGRVEIRPGISGGYPRSARPHGQPLLIVSALTSEENHNFWVITVVTHEGRVLSFFKGKHRK